METVTDRILGRIEIYRDFIKRDDNRNNGTVGFKQSNTYRPGYGARTVGMCKYQDKYLVAVAINYSPNKSDDRVAKITIKQRLHTILDNDFDIHPTDDGFTYVPVEYLDNLWKDEHTYNILHGMIHPTYGNMIVKELQG